MAKRKQVRTVLPEASGDGVEGAARRAATVTPNLSSLRELTKVFVNKNLGPHL